MSENNHRGVTANDSAVDHAVEAGKRLRDAAGDFKDRGAGSTPVDWGKLMVESLLTGNNQPGGQWAKNPAAAIQADELAEACMQIGHAYIDAQERATLITIELRERLAAATDTDWIKSMASTQAALERDAANAFFSLARGFLI